ERDRGVQTPEKTRKKVDPAPTGPATELEGDWEMVSAVFNGAPMDESAVKWCKRTIRGNVTTVTAGPQVFLKAKFTLDSSKDPGFVDYLNLGGPSAGKSQEGIFELNDNILKICVSAPGKPRPTDFSSNPRDGRSFTVWRRSS